MKRNTATILVIGVALLPAVFLLLSWNALPEAFSFRFDFNEKTEQIKTKTDLLYACAILTTTSILIYLLLSRLHRVDPKITAETPRTRFNKLGLLLCVLLGIINFYLIATARYGWTFNTNVLIGFIGVIVLLLGNYMNNIRQNYFVGIRLPWTLNDADNWKRTHQFAAKLWFVAGVIIIALSFFFSERLLIPLFITILVAVVIIPGIYSFNIHRSKN